MVLCSAAWNFSNHSREDTRPLESIPHSKDSYYILREKWDWFFPVLKPDHQWAVLKIGKGQPSMLPFPACSIIFENSRHQAAAVVLVSANGSFRCICQMRKRP